jgi:uncharacterized protein YcbK (DUF882 family)
MPGLVLALSAAFALAPIALEGADANGDTRTISIMNVHTNETGTVTFKRNGVYDAEGIKQLSWLLRDWRRDEPTSMSPRLFDILWEVHQETGSQEPFHAVSGYRSPTTNAMLRRSSRGVAEHSQHMLGKAMDSYLPDVPVARMREIAMHLQRGGVGYYPTSGSPFVHIDAGSVRAWPRMTHDQLARLFPDGKTVHVPADGHPFPGYEQAKLEILAAGGTVAGYSTYADAEPQEMGSGHHKSLWAALFGGADEDEDSAMASGRSTLSRSASARQPTMVAALAPTNGDDTGAHAIIMAQAQSQTQASVQPPTPAADSPRTRRALAGRTSASPASPEPAKPPQIAVASSAPSQGLSSFFSTMRGDTAPAATPPATGTTIAMRSNAQAPAGTTIAMRSDAAVQDDSSNPAGATMIAAFAPLPPRRPKVLAEVAALIDIPLPPQRPSYLDAAATGSAADTQVAAAEPGDAGKLVSLDHPLPPSRAQVLALASTAPGAASPPDTLATASIPGVKAGPATWTPPVEAADAASGETAGAVAAKPDLSAQLVRLDHPLPPTRPVQFALAAAPASGTSSAAQTAQASVAGTPAILRNPDKDGLQALFDTSALVPARHPSSASIKVANAVVRTALPKLAQDVIARPPSTAGHFQASPVQSLANRFSGKAVEPLNSLGFTPTE